jgi:hypothetical protein
LADKSPAQIAELLSKVYSKLGVTDSAQLLTCLERICVAVKLIPQMKNFVHQVSAIVSAFEMRKANSSPNDSFATTSTVTDQAKSDLKLKGIVEIIRSWAENASRMDELKVSATHTDIFRSNPPHFGYQASTSKYGFMHC